MGTVRGGCYRSSHPAYLLQNKEVSCTLPQAITLHIQLCDLKALLYMNNHIRLHDPWLKVYRLVCKTFDVKDPNVRETFFSLKAWSSLANSVFSCVLFTVFSRVQPSQQTGSIRQVSHHPGPCWPALLRWICRSLWQDLLLITPTSAWRWDEYIQYMKTRSCFPCEGFCIEWRFEISRESWQVD